MWTPPNTETASLTAALTSSDFVTSAGRVCYIAFACPGGNQFVGQLPELTLLPVDEHELRASARQKARRRGTDSARRPGDQRHLSIEIAAHRDACVVISGFDRHDRILIRHGRGYRNSFSRRMSMAGPNSQDRNSSLKRSRDLSMLT